MIKKLLAIIALAMVASLSVAGCLNNNTVSPTPTPSTSAATYEGHNPFTDDISGLLQQQYAKYEPNIDTTTISVQNKGVDANGIIHYSVAFEDDYTGMYGVPAFTGEWAFGPNEAAAQQYYQQVINNLQVQGYQNTTQLEAAQFAGHGQSFWTGSLTTPNGQSDAGSVMLNPTSTACCVYVITSTGGGAIVPLE
jgi:hypothetical protein